MLYNYYNIAVSILTDDMWYRFRDIIPLKYVAKNRIKETKRHSFKNRMLRCLTKRKLDLTKMKTRLFDDVFFIFP